jgi:phosphate transport system permease protein
MRKARLEEAIFKGLMRSAFAFVAFGLIMILLTVVIKGLPALTWDMITQTPKGGFYLGKEGGILNAIVGSLYLAGGGTLLALILSLPITLYLAIYARSACSTRRSRWTPIVRLALDVLWGIPSIVYGAFGFIVMLALGLRTSLLAGILVLTLLELPIMVRAMDEVIRTMPLDLAEASYALGATRLETALKVIVRQALPGIVTAILLAFGRGIGDAASVLFTAGYTDRLPDSLLRPAASLPLAVFFQLGTAIPEVQQRAYASALILTAIVLMVSLGSRWLARRLSKYVVK